jgi:PAS domain S-box-containing protein
MARPRPGQERRNGFGQRTDRVERGRSLRPHGQGQPAAARIKQTFNRVHASRHGSGGPWENPDVRCTVVRHGICSFRSFTASARCVGIGLVACVVNGSLLAQAPKLAESTSTEFQQRVNQAQAAVRAKRPEEALTPLESARNLLTDMRDARDHASYHRTAAEAYSALGQMRQAYEASLQLREASQREALQINRGVLSDLRSKYDIERKEREIAQLRALDQQQRAERWTLVAALVTVTVALGSSVVLVRQRMARRLRAANALKAAIVDHAMEAIVTVDADGRIVEFNAAAESIFGWPRDDILGQPLLRLFPQRMHDGLQLLLQDAMAPEASAARGAHRTAHALRHDGSEFDAEVVLWRSELENKPLLSLSLRDVTEQLRNAEIIERQRNDLRQSEKLSTMGGLLAGVAHELNNPLAVVIGRASLLEDSASDPKTQKSARQVREAATRCGRIVRTFLNMARQRDGVRSPVQLNDVARGALEMLGYVMRSNSVSVDVELAEDLPQVVADPDQLGQVVLNLLVNAQQAMSSMPSSRLLRVHTGWTPPHDTQPGHVWLRVADSGPGVPPGLAEKIFAPFFTTKAEGIGTGLGLAVSRSIARNHGGQLGLEPSAIGATFLFSLPLVPPTADPADQPPAAENAVSLQGARVLVVDDEEPLRDLLRSMLESHGMDVSTVASGLEALELLDLTTFDVIITDVRMPDMSGLELFSRIQQGNPGQADRLAFVTGDIHGIDIAHLIEKTGRPAIGKPLNETELLSALTRLAGLECAT